MNSYFERTQKIIDLPSGAKVVIRRLTAGDFRGIASTVPILDAEERMKKVRAGASMPSDSEVEFGIKVSTVMLTKCCGPLEYQGQVLRIVDKPAFSPDLKETDLPIELLEQADAEAIIAAVQEFSGMKGGAHTNGHTFQQAANGELRPAGESIPQAAA